MMDDQTENILRFKEYFKRQLLYIENIRIAETLVLGEEGYVSESIRRYQEILCLNILDTLSKYFCKITYPQKENQNRWRFICFIKERKIWPDGALVSIPFLSDEIKKIGNTTGGLVDHLHEKMSRHDTFVGNNVPINNFDEMPDVLLNLTTSNNEKVAIEKCQHYSLLYSYRNYLVHEFRQPGGAIEFMGMSSGKPCYHGRLDTPEIWYLLYPVEHFYHLVEAAIESMYIFFTKQEINPYLLIEEADRF